MRHGRSRQQVFRRRQVAADSLPVRLCGLEPDAAYSFTDLDSTVSRQATGREAMDQGLQVTIPEFGTIKAPEPPIVILTSNRTPKDWYELFPNPVVAEGILDRLVNNAYRLQLSGDSQRRLRSALPMSAT